MVKSKDFWVFQQHYACDLHKLSWMNTLLQQRQHHFMPSCVNHGTSPSDVASLGFRLPGLHGSLNALNPYVGGELYDSYDGHRAEATREAVSGYTHKRFAIFDQSGNNTQLFFSPLPYPVRPVQNPILQPTNSVNASDFHDDGQPAKAEPKIPSTSAIPERSDENEIIGGVSEMHENTEEINALLYSDDDDDGSDGDGDCDGDGDGGEEDEVASTGRSPFVTKGCYKKRELKEEETLEVASLGGPLKRRRLFDGGYNESAFTGTINSVKDDRPYEYDNNAQSISAICKNDRIHQTLKVLESLIPGVRSKDPLLVIEEAISYLKYLKLNAKALGVV